MPANGRWDLTWRLKVKEQWALTCATCYDIKGCCVHRIGLETSCDSYNSQQQIQLGLVTETTCVFCAMGSAFLYTCIIYMNLCFTG